MSLEYPTILKHTFSHMKKTLESVSFDYRRGIEERVDQGENMDAAVERMLEADAKLVQARESEELVR